MSQAPDSDFKWLVGVLREMAYIFIRAAERRYRWERK